MRIINNKTLSGHGRVPAVREYRIVGLKTSATDPLQPFERMSPIMICGVPNYSCIQ